MVPFSFSRPNSIDIPVGYTPPEEQLLTCTICGFSNKESKMEAHIYYCHITELTDQLRVEMDLTDQTDRTDFRSSNGVK